MNNETLKPLIDRIDILENRIETIEDQKRKQGLGRRIAMGVGGAIKWVGALGGLIALLSFAWDFPQKVKERMAMPNTVTQPGKQLDLTWNKAGQLNFNWPIVLNNLGEGLDTLAGWDASISMTDALGAKKSFNLGKICVIPPERDRCLGPPQVVEARKAPRMEISISPSSKLTLDNQQAFLNPGLYKLTLNLDFEAPGSKIRRNPFINWLANILKLDSKEPQPKPPIEYCFWLTPEAKDEMVNNGRLSSTRPDKRCESSDL